MTIEFFDGFEAQVTGGGPAEQPGWTAISNFTVFTGVGRSGNWGVQTGSPGSASINLPATAKKTLGFAWRLVAGVFGNAFQYVQVASDAGATTHLTLMIDATGHLQLRRGTTAGTVIATSTQIHDANAWRYVEIQATIDGTTGTCKVRIDGITWIDFTGNTRNGGTSTLIDILKISSASNSNWYDDFYVTNGTDDTATTGRPDNDFLGDIKVEGLLPNADGASSQWTPSTGTTHFSLVNEVTPNTTNWVGTATDGNRDLWNIADLGAAVTQVFAVRMALAAAKSDAGAASVKNLIRESSGTVTAETAVPLSTTYTTAWGAMRTTKPGGGAWSVSDVNALQIGAEKAS